MNDEKQSIKLSEVLTTSLEELVKKMDLSDMKVHTDDFGCVCTIELKYIPKGGKDSESKREKRADSPSW